MMNKIYKVIWSRVRNCYVVVSELAKRAGKEKNCHLGPAAHLAAGALCLGLLTFGGQVLPAEAAGEPTVADTTQNQYVAFRVTVNDGNVRGNDNGRDTNTFNGATYHKVTLSDGKTQYWVRDGYTLTEGTAEKYTALSRTDSKFDVAYTGSGKQPADILSSATSAVSSAGVSTNAGETLNQVTASAFEGLSQGGGTQVPGNWDYIIYDPSWEGHTQANTSTRTYYKDGYADMYNRSASATGSPLGFVTTTDANTKLVWNGTLNQYTYNGHAVDTSHLYVIGGKLGVFTSYDGSEVYTGTVYGANNEILMTAMKDGKYYSYWAAPVTDPNATMGTYRVSDYNKDLETLKDNDVALYHNDIKSVDLAKGGDTANPSLTITAMRNGSGTAQAVDGAITVTGGGGTGGQDTTVTLSNTTNGSTVSQVFTTGSKVTANTTAAPSAA
ncbi:ESPR domain-containing protein, partial [Acidaminococcus massiliensis]